MMTNKTKLMILAALALAAVLLPLPVSAQRVDTPPGRMTMEILVQRAADVEPARRVPDEQADVSYPNSPAETDIHWIQVWECWQGWDECGQEPPER